jgi:hypothetical protein
MNYLLFLRYFRLDRYINISLKCKCCVLNEEIQGKFRGNFWKIRQTTNEDFSLQEVFRDGAVLSLHMDIMHVDIRHVLHMNSRTCAGPHKRELHGYLHGHCVLHVIKYRERAHNNHLHIVCMILCILTRPREI